MKQSIQQQRNYYLSKADKLHGTNQKEVEQDAQELFRSIKRKTKRTPYVKSKYFNKDKIFLNIFWQHLHEKPRRDRIRRLRLYACAIDLIQNSTITPDTHENFKEKDELLHRFLGSTKDYELFVVQIKEKKRTNRKDFISIYPL